MQAPSPVKAYHLMNETDTQLFALKEQLILYRKRITDITEAKR